MVYFGGYLRGMYHGQGQSVSFPTKKAGAFEEVFKETYRGQFQFGKRHGLGVLFRSNCGTWTTRFLKGNMANGFGKFQDLNGEVYEGDLLDGSMTGYGVMTFRSGVKLIGKFKNGKLNGHGCRVSEKGVRDEVSMFSEGVFSYVLGAWVQVDMIG